MRRGVLAVRPAIGRKLESTVPCQGSSCDAMEIAVQAMA